MTVPLIISLTGLTCCLLVITINSLTFIHTSRISIFKTPSLLLLYFRCFLDILIGSFVAFYLIVIIFQSFDTQKATIATTYYVVFSSLPMVFLWPIRFVLSISIGFSRISSLLFPSLSKFCKTRFLCYFIIALSVTCGISDIIFLLLIFPVQFVAKIGCSALGCMVNPYFSIYWNITRTIYFSLTLISTIIIAFTLCFCETNPIRLKRILQTDYWILLCMFIATVFDCIPFAITKLGFLELRFLKLGPFVNTLNMLGCCIESVVVSKIFETRQFF